MHRVFTFVVVIFLVACIYEGTRLLSGNNYHCYLDKLPRALFTPLFTVLAYVTIVVMSRVLIPTNFNSTILALCVAIPALAVNFCGPEVIDTSHEHAATINIGMIVPNLWGMASTLGYFSVGPSRSISLSQYSVKEHFTSELVGVLIVIILPPLGGILAHYGLFCADSVLDKVLGCIIAHCSVLLVSVAFFFSTLLQMSKIKANTVRHMWSRRDIFTTFLPSMIRNSLFQVFVCPGCILTCMTFFHLSYPHSYLELYCICFVFSFRVFPSFAWAPCLSGAPKRYTEPSFLDWLIPELAISNQYTWLLALISTLIGCTARKFVFGGDFYTILLSLESLHAFIICRFLGSRIHAKASSNHYMNPLPLWCPTNGRATLPVTPGRSYRGHNIVSRKETNP